MSLFQASSAEQHHECEATHDGSLRIGLVEVEIYVPDLGFAVAVGSIRVRFRSSKFATQTEPAPAATGPGWGGTTACIAASAADTVMTASGWASRNISRS